MQHFILIRTMQNLKLTRPILVHRNPEIKVTISLPILVFFVGKKKSLEIKFIVSKDYQKFEKKKVEFNLYNLLHTQIIN